MATLPLISCSPTSTNTNITHMLGSHHALLVCCFSISFTPILTNPAVAPLSYTYGWAKPVLSTQTNSRLVMFVWLGVLCCMLIIWLSLCSEHQHMLWLCCISYVENMIHFHKKSSLISVCLSQHSHNPFGFTGCWLCDSHCRHFNRKLLSGLHTHYHKNTFAHSRKSTPHMCSDWRCGLRRAFYVRVCTPLLRVVVCLVAQRDLVAILNGENIRSEEFPLRYTTT